MMFNYSTRKNIIILTNIVLFRICHFFCWHHRFCKSKINVAFKCARSASVFRLLRASLSVVFGTRFSLSMGQTRFHLEVLCFFFKSFFLTSLRKSCQN
jgi:hypothetical protein